MLTAVVLLAVFFTSLISGVLGMAGGMILMGVYSAVFAVSSAMILHGITQAVANGYRAYLGRSEIAWVPVRYNLLGSAIAVVVFSIFVFVPNRTMIYFLLGVLPFLTFAKKWTHHLDGMKPRVAVVCGMASTSFQLLAGVSGSLLDMFFIHTKLNRFQTIATKALLQTMGHVIKVVYFTYAAYQTGAAIDLPWELLPFIIVLSAIGTRVGRSILEKIDDAKFRTVQLWCLVGIGCIFLAKTAENLATGWIQ